MNRRDFLKLGLTVTIGGFAMTTNAAPLLTAQTIDFHAHATLSGCVDVADIDLKFLEVAR